MTRYGYDHPVLHSWTIALCWDVSNPRGLAFNLWILKDFSLVITLGPDAGYSAEEGEMFVNDVAPEPCREIVYASSAGSHAEPEPLD